MPVCVALLRGVNVGGRNRLVMAELRSAITDLGHRDVTTLLQSGNVVFRTDRRELEALGVGIATQLRDRFGLDASVVLRTVDELRGVVEDNPFARAAAGDPTKVHVAFLSAEPVPAEALALDAEAYLPERIAPGDRVRYLLLPGGIGRSRLAAALVARRAGVEITVRNWRTVTALLARAEG